MSSEDVIKHFGFLVDDFGFVKLPEYPYVREIHNEFAKSEMIVKVTCDGGYWVDILVPGFDISPIVQGRKRTVDYDYGLFKTYDLGNLDPYREIFKTISKDPFPDKELRYYARLLKENPEILRGDFTKLKWRYRFFKKLGLR